MGDTVLHVLDMDLLLTIFGLQSAQRRLIRSRILDIVNWLHQNTGLSGQARTDAAQA